MRKILALLVLVIALLSLAAAAFAVIIYTDWFWKKALPAGINRFGTGISIEKIDYHRKDIRITGEVLFHDLRMTIRKDGLYSLKVDELSLRNLSGLIFPEGGKILASVTGFSAETDDLKIGHCRINIEADALYFDFAGMAGDLSCESLDVAGNALSDITSQLTGAADRIAGENILMHYRGGTISGRMTFGFSQTFPYALDFKFQDLVFDQDVFDGRVLGRVNGILQASGFAGHLETLEIDVDAPEGAKIQAELLESIIPYLPSKSSTRKDLEALVKVGGYVFCETSRTIIRKTDNDTAVASVSLKTKKLNLVLNPTIDINVEGGLQSIFNVIEFFSN